MIKFGAINKCYKSINTSSWVYQKYLDNLWWRVVNVVSCKHMPKNASFGFVSVEILFRKRKFLMKRCFINVAMPLTESNNFIPRIVTKREVDTTTPEHQDCSEDQHSGNGTAQISIIVDFVWNEEFRTFKH